MSRWLTILPLTAALAAVPAGCGDGHHGKWKVALYGDSLSVESGPYIGRSLTRGGGAVFTNRAVSGTSPCDWFDAIRNDVRRKRVEFAIVEVYGNNASRCQLVRGRRAPTDSRLYWTRYRSDLRQMLSLFPDSTKVMLVAAPAARVDRESGRSHKDRMRRLMNELAADRRNTWAVDSGRRVEEPSGHYTRVMHCAARGPCPNHPGKGLAVVRAHDGLHFCPPMMYAKTDLLEHCPAVAYGAWRFGLDVAVRAARLMDIKAVPPPLRIS